MNRIRAAVRPTEPRLAVARRYAGATGARPARRLVRDLAANDARTWVFEAVVRRYGLGRIGRVVEWRAANPTSALRATGGVLATWHLGATVTAIAPAIAGQRLPVLFFVHGGDPEPWPGIEFTAVWDDPKESLRLGRERLAGGGLVVVAIDAERGSHTPAVPVAGQAVRFRRGAFALARRSHRPVYPMAARWHRYRPVLTLVVGEGLVPGPPDPDVDGGEDVDLALAMSLGRWLEDFLVSSPETLRQGQAFI